MKITFLLLEAFPVDGTVRSTFTLADELSRRHDVELVTVRRTTDRPVLPLSDRVGLRSLVDVRPDAKVPWPHAARAERLTAEPSAIVHPEERSYGKYSAWTDERLTRFLRRLRTDVLVTTRAGLNLMAARLAPRGVVVVGQEHLQLGINDSGILGEIEEWYPRLDALTCLTSADTADYEQRLPAGSCPVHTIGNGLPTRVYPRSRQENKVVVAAGRIVWIKGYDLLIDAFARVVEKHPEWRLRIHGDGPRREELRRKVTRLGLYNNVRMLEPTEDMEGELAKASVLAVSSRAESFGMTIIEGFACGLPAVAFDCPRGPREIITDGVDGLLVPPEDAGAFAETLIRLIDDAELRNRMAANAVASAERFDISVVAAKWERMLTSLSTAPRRDTGRR
ncbi:glycosyltransferase family 4 protein [Actinomadura darangshiensis]|uniref:Glycosyltransferase family 4 protein n=1 Tax=Actinomadura darangshiensis TaxID=705336 RepID=A0A4R5B6R8_9ACTN|nr:glycosyltransferase family 4 protein [Actinomadura darangshiensis]TDD81998.1 glycosyltransferase family 4 protein [Actinomadura darangshiensis]